MTRRFLTVAEVLDLHRMQLQRFGGGDGVRSPGLLESAVAQAEASFAGQLLNPGLFDQAAAYLFHLVRNHPFLDGNKRTGLLAALVFLDQNGVFLGRGTREMYALTMAVAEGRATKAEVAAELERLAGLA